MALSDAFQREIAGSTKHHHCKLVDIAAQLSDDDRKALIAALDSKMSHPAISRALTSEGLPISSSTIGRHRKNRCDCLVRHGLI